MRAEAFHLFVVVMQLATAAGILLFWHSAGRRNFDEPWRPPGFAEHERAFRVPDTVTASVLFLSALLVLAGRPLGRGLALVAAGMLLFLGIIDLVYLRRTGLFARERDGVAHAAIVTGVLAVAALLLVRYLPG